VPEPPPDLEAAARASLRRSAALYALLLLGTLAGVWWIVTHAAGGGAYVTLAFAGGLALLLAYFVLQHLRDMGTPPATREDLVTRKWSRADLIIVMQSYYITVDRTVFRVKPEDYIHLEEGTRVRVVHFPHTLHVVSVERVPEAG
jgi:membrane protein implicated in regulation of membrane protease activity